MRQLFRKTTVTRTETLTVNDNENASAADTAAMPVHDPTRTDLGNLTLEPSDAGRDGTGGHPVTTEERRALALLANDPNGATEAQLIAHDFSVGMLARLVVDGLVIARHEGGGQTVDVVRVKITDAGIPVLAGLHR